uniref:ABC transmembrane type-1 domain-containing protein n=1 Tax=Panagrellus redivivus TaxID=6233 RepID=A0A7E4VDL2_PANRE
MHQGNVGLKAVLHVVYVAVPVAMYVILNTYVPRRDIVQAEANLNALLTNTKDRIWSYVYNLWVKMIIAVFGPLTRRHLERKLAYHNEIVKNTRLLLAQFDSRD